MNVADTTFNFFDTIPVTISGIPQDAMKYAGIVIITIAIISSVLALIGRTKFIWLAGIITSGILVCVYFGFHSKMNEMKDDANKQMQDMMGGMFKDLTDSLFQSVQLGGAGWYIMGSGALLLIISSLLKHKLADL